MNSAVGTWEHNWVGYVDTMIQYYLHTDPGQLSDEQWAEKFAQIADIRKRENTRG